MRPHRWIRRQRRGSFSLFSVLEVASNLSSLLHRRRQAWRKFSQLSHQHHPTFPYAAVLFGTRYLLQTTQKQHLLHTISSQATFHQVRIGSVKSDESGLHPWLSTDSVRPAKAALREIKIPSAISKSLFYLLSLWLFRFRLLVARSLLILAALLDHAIAIIDFLATQFLLPLQQQSPHPRAQAPHMPVLAAQP